MMANLTIIRDLCKKRNITLDKLSNRINMSLAGIHRILTTNSTKIETLEKIADVLNVPITIFFKDQKLLSETEVSKILSSNEIIYIGNTWNTFFEKIKVYKDYFIWKLISLADENYLVKYPYKIPNRKEIILGEGTIARISEMPKENKNIPFSKWKDDKYKLHIKQMKFLHEAFYFTLFDKNIMNITDYIKDGLIQDGEILDYWDYWEGLDDKYKQSM